MRKTADITIEDGSPETNRDYGKTFRLTEMPALQAERWAMKALFAIAKSGVDVSPQMLSGGMSAVAVLGLNALLHVSFADAEPLLAEMLTCVEVKEQAVVRKMTSSDIEEVRTLLTLRDEVLKLHVGFSLAGALSKLTSTTPASNSSSTPTSPPSSGRPSRQGRRR